MRSYPLILFLFLFWLPNFLGWVESPPLDYWGMLAIAACIALVYPASGNPVPANSHTYTAQPGSVSALAFLLILGGIIVVLPYSAILQSLAMEGFSPEIREQSLKLAPVHVPIVVNIFRDALIPFLIIESKGSPQRLRWALLFMAFAFFATFNLAKSFVIINTLAMLMALVTSPIVLAVFVAVLLIPILILLALLSGGENTDVQAFVLDFIIRRILTLTSELGVNVKDFISAHGSYWGSGLPRDFEYELYSFIQHSDLESGWANVYALADASGRGGILGVAMLAVILGLYLLFFWAIVRPVSPRYAIYLWALFCTYIFMQGVFSFGLLLSFFVGPAVALAFHGTLLKYSQRHGE